MTVPSPPGNWWPAGHTIKILRDPFTFLQQQRTLGDVVKIKLGPRPVYLVNEPTLLTRIYTSDSKCYDRGLLFDRVRRLYGDTLPTTAGTAHHQRRRMLHPAFRHDRMKRLATTLGELAQAHTSAWQPGTVLDVKASMRDLALDMAARVLTTTAAGEQLREEFRRSIPPMLNGLMLQTLLPTALTRLPLPANRRQQAAIARMTKAFDTTIARYRETDTDQGDLFSTMLIGTDGNTVGRLADTHVRNEARTMIMAGYEPTSNAMCWAMHEMSRHPDVEEQLHHEVDTHLDAGSLTWESISRLDYTRRFIKEIIRLYAPLLLTRRALREVTVGNITLPAGTNLAYSLFALHRDPSLYPNPLRVAPERWTREHTADTSRSPFMPFGAGAYQCIGEEYAMLAITTVVAAVTARWHLRPLPGSTTHMTASGPAVSPDQMLMTITRRRDIPPR